MVNSVRLTVFKIDFKVFPASKTPINIAAVYRLIVPESCRLGFKSQPLPLRYANTFFRIAQCTVYQRVKLVLDDRTIMAQLKPGWAVANVNFSALVLNSEWTCVSPLAVITQKPVHFLTPLPLARNRLPANGGRQIAGQTHMGRRMPFGSSTLSTPTFSISQGSLLSPQSVNLCTISESDRTEPGHIRQQVQTPHRKLPSISSSRL